jgi:hypothetical protein
MANQVTTKFRIDAQGAINSLNQYNTQLQKTVQLQKQLGATGGGTTTGGGGGGAGVGGLGGLGSLRGLAGPFAGLVSFAAITAGIKEALRASTEATRANRALASSAVEAGKSYNDLAVSAKAFGEAAGISTAQAARSTAQLQRLVSLAGEGDQLEKYQQGFLDLAAARGIQFEELDTLFSGIIAGTDDALNRFGKADPSKLAAQYAAQIGKSVDQLTEQEKILSRLNAFSNDFSIFTGANEARLASFDGRVDQFNSKVENTIAKFGQWISSSYTLAGALDFLNDKLGDGPVGQGTRNEIETRLRLGEGQESIAQDLERQFKEASGSGATSLLFGGAIGSNEFISAYKAYGAQVRAEIEETSKTIIATDKQAADNLANQRQAAFVTSLKSQLTEIERAYTIEKEVASGTLSLIEAMRRSMLDGTVAAEMQYNKEIASARISAIQQETAARNELFSAQMRLASAQANEAEFNKLVLEQSVFAYKQNLAVQLEQINAQQKQADLEKKRIESIRQVTKDLRGQLFGFAGEQNPYVRIFSDAESAIDDLIDKTKEFGKKFRESVKQGIAERGNIALLAQDITNLRGATSLRREARELLFGIDPSQFSPEQAEEYRRRTIQEDIQAIDDAYSRSQRGAAADRLRDQAIIQATQGVSFRELYQSDRFEAIGAREREATRLEQDRDKAREAFDRILNEFDNGGIRVRLAEGQSTVTIIDDSNGRAEVATRPTGASTTARYR